MKMGRCPVVPSEVQDSQLTDSNSKPNHILHPLPSDVRVLHLLSLAYKLGVFFPHDAAALRNVLHPETTSSTTEESSFIDTRGPAPAPQDTLIHVFIDQCVTRARPIPSLIIVLQLQHSRWTFTICATALAPVCTISYQTPVACCALTHTGTWAADNAARASGLVTTPPASGHGGTAWL